MRVREDQNSNTGKAMPEFPGYCGPANPELPVIKVKAVTTRRNPIMQTCIGPSEEHVSMAGIPTEASILQMIEKAMPGKVQNVYCASSGGGKYILRFCSLRSLFPRMRDGSGGSAACILCFCGAEACISRG